jgi:hypothetical protein
MPFELKRTTKITIFDSSFLDLLQSTSPKRSKNQGRRGGCHGHEI